MKKIVIILILFATCSVSRADGFSLNGYDVPILQKQLLEIYFYPNGSRATRNKYQYGFKSDYPKSAQLAEFIIDNPSVRRNLAYNCIVPSPGGPHNCWNMTESTKSRLKAKLAKFETKVAANLSKHLQLIKKERKSQKNQRKLKLQKESKKRKLAKIKKEKELFEAKQLKVAVDLEFERQIHLEELGNLNAEIYGVEASMKEVALLLDSLQSMKITADTIIKNQQKNQNKPTLIIDVLVDKFLYVNSKDQNIAQFKHQSAYLTSIDKGHRIRVSFDTDVGFINIQTNIAKQTEILSKLNKSQKIRQDKAIEKYNLLQPGLSKRYPPIKEGL